jgi:penicillin-binding protein 2
MNFDHQRPASKDVETTVFQYVVAAIFLWLLTGFWKLQVQNPEIYEERAENNSVKALPIPAPRGRILDRDGRVLVDNAQTFQVRLSRDAAREENVALIAEGLEIPYGSLERRFRDLKGKSGPDYEQIVLKDNLPIADVAFLEAHREHLPELELIRTPRRRYPLDGMGAHVLGYVGEISKTELNLEEFVLHDAGAEVGKTGVERRYNDFLVGRDGRRLVLVDSRSRRVRDLNREEAEAGQTLRLTIDLDLQVVADLAMGARRGAVVALDPRNGEVLAMTSKPEFDVNKFVGGVSADDWREVTRDLDKPMLNRAIQAQLAPGSIFKPFVALAGLMEEVIDKDFQVFCSGGGTFYGRYFRCHKAGGHGWVSMEQALRDSCDVYFYNLGKELGIDRIAKYSELAGFGRRTGIDLPGEAEGIVPSSAWKLRFFRDKWYAGETISVSIGQGALTVTPLQAAHAIGGLAMGGVWHRPHLIPDDEAARLLPNYEPSTPDTIDVQPHELDPIIRGLWRVVNDGGTGGRARIPGRSICGKTGSAQRISRSLAFENNDPRLLDDGWFVAFAPCEAPEIAVAVLFENGEHGSWAAPIARDVIKAYFDKQDRLAPPRPDDLPPVVPDKPRTETAERLP